MSRFRVRKSTVPFAAAPAAALLMATPLASARDDFNVALGAWSYEPVYRGWSAAQLLEEADVYGPTGDERGSVENLLIDRQGRIVALVAQIGGFMDIGDTHIAVPLSDVSFQGYDVQIPVVEDYVQEYWLFDEEYYTRAHVGDLERVDDDFAAGYEIWKATELLDDYTVTETGDGHGYVHDLIFDDDGMLRAVVVNTNGAYYAWPWFGYGYDGYAWHPGFSYYVLPFDADEIAEFDTPFDYDKLEGAPPP